MKCILFDDAGRHKLLPFTHTRPVADIRCGILTMRERWERLLGQTTGTLTEAYLQPVFPAGSLDDNLLLNGAVFATARIAEAALALQPGEKLATGKLLIAVRTNDAMPEPGGLERAFDGYKTIPFEEAAVALSRPWDIFSLNGQAITDDFLLLMAGRKSAPLPDGVITGNAGRIFLEEGAVVQPGCILNPHNGYIYVGRDAEIMEGVMLRGSVAVCDHAVVKMGAKIYGATTIGPGCKVGGEISNTVFFANSNKGHEGFVGNAVIGEWCNLGADTNCSNLKNNYDLVKVWDESTGRLVPSGLQFCGLLMGDHSKCGINTMFNTATVVGVSANIFGSGFPDKFVPSFTWGACDSSTTYEFSKAMETADRMMGRRNRQLSSEETEMLRYVFEHTAHQRENR